jgi:hypothetical protein
MNSRSPELKALGVLFVAAQHKPIFMFKIAARQRALGVLHGRYRPNHAGGTLLPIFVAAISSFPNFPEFVLVYKYKFTYEVRSHDVDERARMLRS